MPRARVLEMMALLVILLFAPLIALIDACTPTRRFTGGQQCANRAQGAPDIHRPMVHFLAYEPSDVPKDAFEAALARTGERWQIVPVGSRQFVDAVVATGKSLHSRAVTKQAAAMRCRLDVRALDDKATLHELLAGSGLIAETRPVVAETVLPSNAVWILRGNWSYRSSAVGVVHNQRELMDTVARLLKHAAEVAPWVKKPRIIASDYIADPALFDGCKFHIRAYITVTSGKLRKSAYLLKYGLIVPAEEPYQPGDWQTASIHDSRGGNNKKSLCFRQRPTALTRPRGCPRTRPECASCWRAYLR